MNLQTLSAQHDKNLSNKTKQLGDSIDTAVTFLLEARNEEGWWLDYDLSDSSSDEWMTAYVGTILAVVPDTRVAEAVMNAWKLLKSSCRSTGGWGYSRICPADASTTSWGLQFAEAVGMRDSEPAQQAKAFLDNHQQPNGGMACYATDKTVRDFFKVPPHLSTEGYCQSHVCISAEAATLPEFRLRLRDYLKATQTSQGNWQGYFWYDHEYATAFAAEALAAYNQAIYQSCIDQAVAWGLQRLSSQGFVATSDFPDGSPFATALCLRLLLLDKVNPEVKTATKAAIHWLLDQQKPNGAWISSAGIQVPFPFELDPSKFTQWIRHGKRPPCINFDQNSIHTTATVLYSLQKVAELREE